MWKKVEQVVGIAFIENGKLLVSKSVRSSKDNLFTLVGGGVKEGEEVIAGAVREITEEIANGFQIEEKDLIEIASFVEPAASDPDILIQMHIFVSKKKVDVNLTSNDEILEYSWIDLKDNEKKLSSSIIDYVLPFAKKYNLMY